MSDLRELYQEVILDHSRNPRNRHPLPGANHEAEGYNSLCGDRVTVRLILEDDIVQDVAFEGAGCAISTASASLMTDAVKGKPLAEVEALWKRFHGMITGDPSLKEEHTEDLGKLAVLAGVREFPVRVKCASLAWHTLLAAVHDADEPVSTE